MTTSWSRYLGNEIAQQARYPNYPNVPSGGRPPVRLTSTFSLATHFLIQM